MMSWIAARRLVVALAAGLLLAGGSARAAEDAVLNVYSARHYPTDEDLYAAFEKESGITVNLIEGKGDELMTRMQNEGAASPADIFIAVDAGNLWRVAEAGLFQPTHSAILDQRIPEHLRDAQDRWFGFSRRFRIIAASKDRVPDGAITTYAQLADPKFKGKVCMRSSNNVYQLSIMAGLIEKIGADKAEAWARGVVANFAYPPQGADTDQIRSIAAGECDLAMVNHYYYVRLETSDKEADRDVASKVKLIFPDQDTDGAFVNIGGAGIAAHAPHPENAQKFLEYLSSDAAQKIFALGNDEFPVVPSASTDNPALKALGSFKESKLNVEVYGRNQADAQMVYDRAGWQ